MFFSKNQKNPTIGGLWRYQPKLIRRTSAHLEGAALDRALAKIPEGHDIPEEDRILPIRNRLDLAHSSKLINIIPGKYKKRTLFRKM